MTKLSEEGMSKAQDRKIFLVLKKKRERDGGTFEGKKKKKPRRDQRQASCDSQIVNGKKKVLEGN